MTFLLALYSNKWGGSCLTHVGTEGWGSRKFTISPLDGDFSCYANVWDYYKGSSNEKIGSNYCEHRLTYKDFSKDGKLQVDIWCGNNGQGQVTIRFDFELE